VARGVRIGWTAVCAGADPDDCWGTSLTNLPIAPCPNSFGGLRTGGIDRPWPVYCPRVLLWTNASEPWKRRGMLDGPIDQPVDTPAFNASYCPNWQSVSGGIRSWSVFFIAARPGPNAGVDLTTRWPEGLCEPALGNQNLCGAERKRRCRPMRYSGRQPHNQPPVRFSLGAGSSEGGMGILVWSVSLCEWGRSSGFSTILPAPVVCAPMTLSSVANSGCV